MPPKCWLGSRRGQPASQGRRVARQPGSWQLAAGELVGPTCARARRRRTQATTTYRNIRLRTFKLRASTPRSEVWIRSRANRDPCDPNDVGARGSWPTCRAQISKSRSAGAAGLHDPATAPGSPFAWPFSKQDPVRTADTMERRRTPWNGYVWIEW